jgi:hypothetical protein
MHQGGEHGMVARNRIFPEYDRLFNGPCPPFLID